MTMLSCYVKRVKSGKISMSASHVQCALVVFCLLNINFQICHLFDIFGANRFLFTFDHN